MAAENAGGSALMGMGGCRSSNWAKSGDSGGINPLLNQGGMTQGFRAEKAHFCLLFQLGLTVRTQICVLIISICNAAGCRGSHSQFLSQCAKTARIVERNKEQRKKNKKNRMDEGEKGREKVGKKKKNSLTVRRRASSMLLENDGHIRHFLL